VNFTGVFFFAENDVLRSTMFMLGITGFENWYRHRLPSGVSS